MTKCFCLISNHYFATILLPDFFKVDIKLVGFSLKLRLTPEYMGLYS
jgi:hypothetical protein